MKKFGKSILTLTLVLGLGLVGCSNPEEVEEEPEIISTDASETIDYMFNEENGLEYDVTWWSGVNYYMNYVYDDGEEPFYYTVDTTLVEEESGFASGLYTKSVYEVDLNYETFEYETAYDYTEYDYLADGLVYTYYTDDDEYHLYNLNDYDEDTKYSYSVAYFLDDTQLDIDWYCTQDYLTDYLDYILYGYEVSGSISTTSSWTKATFSVSAEYEDDMEKEESIISYELIWDKDGKLISYADDYYSYYYMDYYGLFSFETTFVLDTEASLFEGPVPDAPDWVVENYNL